MHKEENNNVGKTNLRYTTVGLTEYEIGSVKKLFSLVQKKSINNWSYTSAVRGEHFDLMIARESPVGGFTVDLMLLLDGQVLSENEVSVSWPLRALDMLRYVRTVEEKHGVYKRIRAGSLSMDIRKRLKTPANFNNLLLSLPNGSFVLIDTKHKRVVFMSDSNSAIKLLLSYQSSEIYFSSTRTPKNFAWKKMISLRDLLWRLGSKENTKELYDWSLDSHVFQFKQFPYFSGLEIKPYMLKLASIFTRKACTLRTAIKFSKLDQKTVSQFLHACMSIGTPIEITEQANIVSNSDVLRNKNSDINTENMLSILKGRLGAIFDKSADHEHESFGSYK